MRDDQSETEMQFLSLIRFASCKFKLAISIESLLKKSTNLNKSNRALGIKSIGAEQLGAMFLDFSVLISSSL